MAFRFIHTADIHLDSPLRSLSLRNRDLAELIGNSTRQALTAIVDLCIAEQVDALVIAGDLYDGEQTSMKTARFLAAQMQRLAEAGIAVHTIRGNHDALSRITQELILPPSVKIYGGRAETVEMEKAGLGIAFHGLSFSRPQAPESLLPKYRPPLADRVNIGIMHTSLDGAPGHDVYAPCGLADLQASGFDYWALGHIHQRSQYDGRTTVVMSGMPQGRDINEAGPKSVSLVTVQDDRTVSVEERPTSIAEFGRVAVDLSAATAWHEVADSIERAVAGERAASGSSHLVARLMLTGQTPLSWRMRRDRDLLLAEAEQRAESLGRTWIEKIEIRTEPPAETTGKATADPLIELGALMRDDVAARHGLREDIRQMVKDLRDELPPESRGFAGNDEAQFEAYVDQLLTEGGDDVLARLRAEAAEAS
ncbi:MULTISPECIES: metallophosphoesterase family protein [Alphaproteobacteria]|uniref:Serine/threonine phosphatase n=2 Tax=Alphaproteobacteria TaxID=28211 RepID=A0A512HL46_9HYPH|nr:MULTISPECIES: DNA repair exonuclease [Alphaproteobacteria]GEO86165.1 serine/threonine phosphatase [Ciceribacter naphthalenivorans]GLR22732.1 serine/threonine phosphatase [Ciceribacter naphthalenivorans]GLT05588.1 serine/threonine phosphatase [Sphingomonas psychrolutea]